VLVAWPFDGPGPEGRAPLELVEVKNSVVTRVAAHPHTHFIACGYEDGTLAMVDLATQAGGKVQVTKRGPVTCLAWSRDGHHLVAGADDGRAMIFSVPGEAA
jgi:WD40 repeat protein